VRHLAHFDRRFTGRLPEEKETARGSEVRYELLHADIDRDDEIEQERGGDQSVACGAFDAAEPSLRLTVVHSQTKLRLLPGNVLPKSIRSILELPFIASPFVAPAVFAVHLLVTFALLVTVVDLLGQLYIAHFENAKSPVTADSKY